MDVFGTSRRTLPSWTSYRTRRDAGIGLRRRGAARCRGFAIQFACCNPPAGSSCGQGFVPTSAWKRWLGDAVEVVAEPSWFSQEAEDEQGWKGDDDADVTTRAVQVNRTHRHEETESMITGQRAA